jgi:hypothetical protein
MNFSPLGSWCGGAAVRRSPADVAERHEPEPKERPELLHCAYQLRGADVEVTAVRC